MRTVILNNGQPDREYWNVMKGLGILSIVIGHSWMWAQHFVYLYHVPMFYFISGYLYNESKYGDRPWLNLHNRAHLWGWYVLANIPFILLHNVFVDAHMVPVFPNYAAYYTKTDMVIQMAYTCIGWNQEFLPGPLWFVPSLVMMSAIMGFIICFSRRIQTNTGSKALKFLFQIICVIIFSVVGYMMLIRRWQLPVKFQITLAALPYMWVGYILRNYLHDIEKWVKWEIAVLILAFLLWYQKDHLISLADFMVVPTMYITAFMGIYVCMWLAGIMREYPFLNPLKKMFSDFGCASFWIMAVHFVIIRLIDLAYAVYVAHDVNLMYEQYLGAHPALVPVYLFCGVVVPTLLFKLRKKIQYGRKAGQQA